MYNFSKLWLGWGLVVWIFASSIWVVSYRLDFFRTYCLLAFKLFDVLFFGNRLYGLGPFIFSIIRLIHSDLHRVLLDSDLLLRFN
jgi:hypothetical protein